MPRLPKSTSTKGTAHRVANPSNLEQQMVTRSQHFSLSQDSKELDLSIADRSFILMNTSDIGRTDSGRTDSRMDYHTPDHSPPHSSSSDPRSPSDPNLLGTPVSSSSFNQNKILPSKLDCAAETRHNSTKPPRLIIPPESRGDTGAISDALNEVYALLESNQTQINSKLDEYISANDAKFAQLDKQLVSVQTQISQNKLLLDQSKLSLDSQAGAIAQNKLQLDSQANTLNSLNTDKVSLSDFKALKSQFEEYRRSCDLALQQARSVYVVQQSLLNTQSQNISNNIIDIKRLSKNQLDTNERLNLYDIRSNHLFLNIDGLPESRNLSTLNNLINRLNKDAKAGLVESDFHSVYRVGKQKKKGSPPPPAK